MFSSLLLTDLMQQVWFMEPGYADTFKPLVLSLLKGEQLDSTAHFEEERSKRAAYAIDNASMVSSSKYANYNEAPENSIAVHTLIGPVIKRSQWCGPIGTMEIADTMKKADKHPNIGAHLFIIESGGGAANALQIITETMDGLKKPILVYAEDILASAAYGIAAHADEIVVNHPQSIVGSIGTMITLADWNAYFEKEGLKIHNIYADASTNKNKMFHDAMAGDYKGIKGQLLNPWNNSFIADVKASRSGVLKVANEVIFTGQTFTAEIAKEEHGLIDHIGNMEFAINRVSELMQSGRKSTSATQSTLLNNDMLNLNKFPKMTSLIGKSAEEITSVMLAEVNAELKEKGVTATLMTQAALEEQINAETTPLKTRLQTANDATAKAEGRILAAVKVFNPEADAETAASFDLAANINTLKNTDAADEATLRAEKEKETGDQDADKPVPLSQLQR